MNNFSSQFPVTSQLIAALGKEAQILANQGESAIQKAEDSVAVVIQLAPIFSQLGALKSELSGIARDASGSSQLEAVENLVSDFAFTSEKAKAIVASSFALGEDLVALVKPIEATAKAVQALLAAVK